MLNTWIPSVAQTVNQANPGAPVCRYNFPGPDRQMIEAFLLLPQIKQ